MYDKGGSRIFKWKGRGEGGGAQNDYVCMHHEREVPYTAGLGSSARFRALETLKGFICSIKLSEPYFENSDTNGIRRKSIKKVFFNQH